MEGTVDMAGILVQAREIESSWYLRTTHLRTQKHTAFHKTPALQVQSYHLLGTLPSPKLPAGASIYAEDMSAVIVGDSTAVCST